MRSGAARGDERKETERREHTGGVETKRERGAAIEREKGETMIERSREKESVSQ